MKKILLFIVISLMLLGCGSEKDSINSNEQEQKAEQKIEHNQTNNDNKKEQENSTETKKQGNDDKHTEIQKEIRKTIGFGGVLPASEFAIDGIKIFTDIVPVVDKLGVPFNQTHPNEHKRDWRYFRYDYEPDKHLVIRTLRREESPKLGERGVEIERIIYIAAGKGYSTPSGITYGMEFDKVIEIYGEPILNASKPKKDIDPAWVDYWGLERAFDGLAYVYQMRLNGKDGRVVSIEITRESIKNPELIKELKEKTAKL